MRLKRNLNFAKRKSGLSRRQDVPICENVFDVSKKAVRIKRSMINAGFVKTKVLVFVSQTGAAWGTELADLYER